MKFTKEQIKHTLRWNIAHLFSDISGFFFSIRLKFAIWRFGGPDKIPPGYFGPLIKGGEEGAKDLKRAVNIYEICEYISDTLGIPKDRRQIRVLMSNFVMGKIEDVETNKDLQDIYSRPMARLAIYRLMCHAEEISPNDITLATQKPDWKLFCDWLHTPIDDAGNPIQTGA